MDIAHTLFYFYIRLSTDVHVNSQTLSNCMTQPWFVLIKVKDMWMENMEIKSKLGTSC